MGLSMGGMIVQRLAIDHPDRLLSMTSVMSRTGEPEYGQSSPEALAVLTAKPAKSRDEFIDSPRRRHRDLRLRSRPGFDEDDLRARAAAAYDRCFCPQGVGRQMLAVFADPPRGRGPARGAPAGARRSTAAATRSSTPAAAAAPPSSSPAPATSRSRAWATTTRRRCGSSGPRPGPDFAATVRRLTERHRSVGDRDDLV